MKKGVFLLLAIILGAFVLHGCHSQKAVHIDKDRGVGYPVGHDMHPGSKDDDGFDNGGYS